MPTQGFRMFDWKRLDQLIELGSRHALAELEEVRASLAA
jgi:hypothetical protein